MKEIPEILIKRAEELERYYEEYYPSAAPLIKQCFLNTIQTTVQRQEDGSYFVITGDIPAMWLRDSAAQVRPYIKYAARDEALREIIKGIILTQMRQVTIDPYANAFNAAADGAGHREDETEQNDWIWERKYETDSLCAPIYLSYCYWKETACTDVFDDTYLTSLKKIISVWKTEQTHWISPYYFRRRNDTETDTLPQEGRGNRVKATGMTWSGFRPSDDRCVYGYLIPANMMASKALQYAEEICREVYADGEISGICKKLRMEILDGIKRYGIVEHPKFDSIYAYETDGYGNYVLMDDANSPSLLSMPYLGFCEKNEEVYLQTRRYILSSNNPYYYCGKYASGIGSPHTPENYVWHIGLIMQALTTNDREEIRECVNAVLRTHADTDFIHESFDVNNPNMYTRAWFAWANSLFSELMDNLACSHFWEQNKEGDAN